MRSCHLLYLVIRQLFPHIHLLHLLSLFLVPRSACTTSWKCTETGGCDENEQLMHHFFVGSSFSCAVRDFALFLLLFIDSELARQSVLLKYHHTIIDAI
uniref:Putative secreted protein ovary overexpressed n=1 Tax=Rhipicephalus microplus TaxID=6941 RepID=A0A6M2D9W6_RHIMP